MAIYAIMVVFVILFARLFYLQLIEGPEFRRLSENNCIRLQSISPPRGLIFDCNGELLVDNRPAFDLYITLKDAAPIKQTIENLSRYTGVSTEILTSKISAAKRTPSYKPILLLQDFGRDVLAAVEVHRYNLPGVTVNIQPRRHYIHRKYAAHLLGYLSEINSEELSSGKYKDCKSGDYIGKFGVEKVFENYLRGEHGGRQVEVNVAGQVIRVLQTVEAKPGCNIYLTIDHQLQEKTETLLNGKAGAAIAMNPANGEILAMVSSPSFDQNDFVNGLSHEAWNALISNPRRPMINKAIQGEYPPASTYKIITAMAALEEGIIDKTTTLYCSGRYKCGDRVFRDWKEQGHGTLNIVDALAQSCDIFFYQIGQKLGVDRLAWYARACGLGDLTGIILDHENRGLVPTAAWKKRRTGVAWQAGETLSVAIGQGYNLVTPLQMLVSISAVANDGNRYRPLIFRKIETQEGELVLHGNSKKVGVLPASGHTLDIIAEGLFKVVNHKNGTGFNARITGIKMSGKTGTAQVVGRVGDEIAGEREFPYHLKPHAWFAAYAPSDDPTIAVVVFVEHGEHGSSVAAPIASEMIKTYLVSTQK